MKKILLFLIAVAMVMTFGSCHKEGKYSPSKKISKIYRESGYDGYFSGRYLSESWNWNKNQLQSIYHHSSDGSISYTEDFTYTKGRISRVDHRYPSSSMSYYYSEFTYDGGKLSRMADYYNGQLESEFSFTYKNGKISTMNVTNYYSYYDKSETMPMVKSSFLSLIIPELSDKIIENLYRLSNKSKGGNTYTYSIEWKGDNISKIKGADGDEWAEIELTYDNKKNPFYGFLNSDFDEECFSKNNITRETWTEYDEGEMYNYSDTYTYTYDGNWPISKRYQYGDEYGTTYYEYVK
ncbi:MAG: hypothetical protein MJZ72_02925 [Bacteroidales bacterium]|nr:hypothetical protein [Bacteroidales bacterium]